MAIGIVEFLHAGLRVPMGEEQGMRRQQWDEALRWMSVRHGMVVPDEETRRLLLDYLSEALPPRAPPAADKQLRSRIFQANPST